MIRKILMGFGLLGAVLAAEGLNRFGSLVSALGGADGPIYMLLLLGMVFCAGILLLALFGKRHKIAKWVGLVIAILSAFILSAAPSHDVVTQIFVGVLLVGVGLLSIETADKVAVDQ